MPTITEQANSAFRDYEVPGVVLSGAHRPVPSEIRSLFGSIDASVKSTVVDAYGAVGDGVTNDTAAFTSAFASLPASGGVVLLTPGKSYYTTGLVIPPWCGIKGDRHLPTRFTTNTSTTFSGLGGIVVSSSGTIKLSAGSFIQELFIKRLGITFPVTDVTLFAGTAITMGGDDCRITGVTAVGFDAIVKIDPALTYLSRYIIDGLYGDGINGIIIDKPSFASSVIKDVQLWPFACQPNVTIGVLRRSGYGLYITGAQDDTWIDNIITYGFFRGVFLQATGQFNFGKVWCDYPSAFALGSGSIGLLATANVTAVTFGNLNIYGCEFGIVQQSNNTEWISVGQAHLAILAGSAVTSTGGDLRFDNIHIDNTKGFCFNFTNSGSRLFARGDVHTIASIAGYNSLGVLSLPSGAVDSFFDVDVTTDLPLASILHFTNTLNSVSIASGATISLPVAGDKFIITGSSNISAINIGWGGREIILKSIGGTASLVSGGNISLTEGNGYTFANGSSIHLAWDVVANLWRERWRSNQIVQFKQISAGVVTAVLPGLPIAADNAAAIAAGVPVNGLYRTAANVVQFRV